MVVDRKNILLQLSHKVKTWHGPRETSPISSCEPMQLDVQMNLQENKLGTILFMHLVTPHIA